MVAGPALWGSSDDSWLIAIGSGLASAWVDSLLARVVLVGAALVGLFFLTWWAGQRALRRPMRDVARMARQLSRGDLSQRLEMRGTGPLADLARSLNELSSRWAADIQTIDRQRLALATLVNQLHEGVIVTRADGRVTLINPAAVSLLNLGAAADINRLVGQIVERVIPQHDIQRLLHVDRTTTPDQGTTAEIVSPSGTPVQEARIQVERDRGQIHLLARASDVTLPDIDRVSAGPAVGRMLVLTDITELSRAMQIKSDFVANASHELRTPLSTIRAAVEAVSQMNLLEEAEDATRFINVIDRHSARLSAMVSDLLDLARLESPTARFARETLAPREVLLELQERFADVFRAKGLIWEMRCDDALGSRIVISPQLLRLVLDNLVDNATKFTERGKRVRVGCVSAATSVTFMVEDEGCGIPEPEQERVFERFYQVERARSGPERGTGLGLSIVRHAVVAMGGTLRLQSQVGVGTTVSFSVPQFGSSAADEGDPAGNAEDRAA